MWSSSDYMQSVLILLALRLQISFVLQYSSDLRIHVKNRGENLFFIP